MNVALFALIAAGQALNMATPAPPAIPTDQMITALKRACMSDGGIVIAVKSHVEFMNAVEARRATAQSIEREVEDAKFSDPIDPDRIERALKARNDDQFYRLAQSNNQTIRVLRMLSPSDRAIYVRRGYGSRMGVPERVCPVR